MTEPTGNLYPGINAHLNSFLQQRGGGWESFHTRFISEMQVHLDRVLPPNYYAITEKSLQITQYGIDEERRTSAYPDVSIFRHAAASPTPAISQDSTAPTMTLPIRQVMVDEEEETVHAVMIYEYESGQVPGKPVTRIELLSPANKPNGSDYRGYITRRRAALKSDITLVEIDFLHKQRPLLTGFPSYPDHDEGAVPYVVLVTDPHPDYANGRVDFYEIAVDDGLPKVRIPLLNGDATVLDFGAVYNYVIESTRVFRIVVDYNADPVEFDTFTPEDQAKIHAILEKIRRESSGN